MKRLVVIDGQGGGFGRRLIEGVRAAGIKNEIVAVGLNSMATSAMLKAGADAGATGENPVIVNSRDADIIIGPIGIVMANALLGEITPAMAVAVGSSPAQKILIPSNQCHQFVAGCQELPLGAYIREVVERVDQMLKP